jgi:6-pyruvoyltetrahydropterin/6-carboxytetrahydropterin synthase
MSERILYMAAVPFEAARSVALLPEGHRSHRLHGHSFVARVRAALPAGWASFSGAETDNLIERLREAVGPLDYRLLNDVIDVPTDENIARWLQEHLNIPAVETLGVLSTQHEGVELDQNGHAHIWRRFRFEAAHQLPNVPDGHKCGRMHGHGFEVILHADQELGRRAMGDDFNYLETCWAPVQAQLHHACLNDIPGLENPTSEMIASWIWKRLQPSTPELSWVTVYETASCGCSHDGTHYRIWKDFSFDSATRLSIAPPGDSRSRIHGHTYMLRLHLSAPLDEIMGWIIDFGDVNELFTPVLKCLDHHALHELPGLQQSDLAALAYWVRKQVAECLPQLDRITLHQIPGCGVMLSWAALHPALPA